MIDDLRPRGLVQRHYISERNQAVSVGTHIIISQIACAHAEWLIGLHVYAIRAIVEVEIVHVLRTHVDTERLCDLANRYSDGLRLLAIDLHQLLRIIRGVTGEQSSQILALV